ncbi:copper-binding protein [Variovorax sp. GT1P44]|uniref:copper-binding protein n=1 Tax=Variovorax sp. GT1P44 TaxID=3443742 RepID=UPI003F462984
MFGFRKTLLASLVVMSGLAHAQPAAGDLSEGEVRKVDKESATVTLKHGPLTNLDMPGMTMIFKVGDNRMLDAVQTGDKVRFRAEMVEGRLVVTRIETVR